MELLSLSDEAYVGEFGLDSYTITKRNEYIVIAFKGTHFKDNKFSLTNQVWLMGLPWLNACVQAFGERPKSRDHFDGLRDPRGLTLDNYIFTRLINNCKPDILSQLSGISDNMPIYLCGHSRGGALATYCAVMLNSHGKNVKGVYTFGAPRLSLNESQRGFLSSVVIHYENKHDPVCMVLSHIPAAGKVHTVESGDRGLKAHTIDAYRTAILEEDGKVLKAAFLLGACGAGAFLMMLAQKQKEALEEPADNEAFEEPADKEALEEPLDK
jgi:pimeloyl-ACP methyl ester carboxylesterase